MFISKIYDSRHTVFINSNENFSRIVSRSRPWLPRLFLPLLRVVRNCMLILARINVRLRQRPYTAETFSWDNANGRTTCSLEIKLGWNCFPAMAFLPELLSCIGVELCGQKIDLHLFQGVRSGRNGFLRTRKWRCYVDAVIVSVILLYWTHFGFYRHF